MKIKALAGACKSHHINLYTKMADGKPERQYIMLDGRAIYPIEEGMPMLNADSLLAVMDIPMDKRGMWHVTCFEMREKLMNAVADDREDEPELKGGKTGYVMNGYDLLTAWEGNQVYLYMKGYTKPIEDIGNIAYLRMKKRKVNGVDAIVFLDGMKHAATVMPEKDFDEEIMLEMSLVGRKMEEEGMRKGERND